LRGLICENDNNAAIIFIAHHLPNAMVLKPLIPSLFFFFLLAACSPTGKSFQYQKPAFIASNVDTVISYTFCMLRNNRFIYTIVQMNAQGRQKRQGYSGSVSELIYNGTTTLHLIFDKNRRPDSLTDYLVVEGSGNYLIQHFVNSPRRVFMLIDRLIRR
jgi:hypothetical protein